MIWPVPSISTTRATAVLRLPVPINRCAAKPPGNICRTHCSKLPSPSSVIAGAAAAEAIAKPTTDCAFLILRGALTTTQGRRETPLKNERFATEAEEEVKQVMLVSWREREAKGTERARAWPAMTTATIPTANALKRRQEWKDGRESKTHCARERKDGEEESGSKTLGSLFPLLWIRRFPTGYNWRIWGCISALK